MSFCLKNIIMFLRPCGSKRLLASPSAYVLLSKISYYVTMSLKSYYV